MVRNTDQAFLRKNSCFSGGQLSGNMRSDSALYTGQVDAEIHTGSNPVPQVWNGSMGSYPRDYTGLDFFRRQIQGLPGLFREFPIPGSAQRFRKIIYRCRKQQAIRQS